MKTIVITTSSLLLILLLVPPWGVSMNMNTVTINGEIDAIAKIQAAYRTPLEAISFNSCAHDRSDQNFRGFGNIVLSYGTPGFSEWFSAAKIKFDANDPDLKESDYSAEGRENNGKRSEYDIETEYAFVMYRPYFEIFEGRPFGFMAGMIPLKATANAAYFHFFKADPEEDFNFYTLTALTGVPGIGIDFHLFDRTAVGVAFARGINDASEIATRMASESAENWIFWVESTEFNIGLNIGCQYVKGEGSASDQWITPAGNALYEYRQPYEHILLNGMLTYTFGIAGVRFMPAAGYELIKGDECMALPGNDPRSVESAIMSYGLKVGMALFNVPNEISVLYTELQDREAINGIESIPKGTIATALEAYGVSGVPGVPSEGRGRGVSSLLEFQSTLHAEYAIKVNGSTEVGLFFYQLNTVDDKTKYAPYIKSQLQSGFEGTSFTEYIDPIVDGFDKDGQTYPGVADTLRMLEWTDSTSYGLFARMVF